MFKRICAVVAISVAAVMGAALPGAATGDAPQTHVASGGWSWQE